LVERVSVEQQICRESERHWSTGGETHS